MYKVNCPIELVFPHQNVPKFILLIMGKYFNEYKPLHIVFNGVHG